MKAQITFYLSALMVITTLAFMLSYCTKSVDGSENTEEQKSANEILNTYKSVGLVHNEVMEEVIEVFANAEQFPDSRQAYFEMLEEALVGSLERKELVLPADQKEIRYSITKEVDRIQSYYDRNFEQAGKKNRLSFLQQTIEDLDVELSDSQNEILTKINTVIENSATTDEIILELEKINNSKAVLELKKEDRHPIYAATSVGIESARYWNENLSHWAAVLTESGDETMTSVQGGLFDLNGRRIIGDDVAGAVGGAVGGCMGGAMAGGVGCAPGAASGALVGGAGASAASTARQLWDNFWN